MSPVLRRKLRGFWVWARRRRAGLVLLPWLVVSANAVAAKYNQIVMAAVSDSLVGAPAFSCWQHIHEFKYDLLLGFVVMPLLLLSLVRLGRWRWVLGLTAAWALLWQVIMSAEMATYAMANNYATFRTMVMAFVWAVQHPKNQFLTLPLYDKIYANGWMALVALTILLVTVIPWRRLLWWSRAGLVMAGVAVLMTGATALTRGDNSHRILLFRDVMLSLAEHKDSEMMGKSVPQLLEAYREDANLTQAGSAPSAFAGKARDYNVVLMVMESISAEAFDPAKDSLLDMPNARRLRQSAFVGKAHYTSYPLTNRASFGIFASIYSESAVGFALHDRQDIKLPGMIRDLDDAGYETGYFGFIWRDEDQRDDTMMDSLGFTTIVDPQANADELSSSEMMFGGPVLQAAAKDHDALVAMRQQIRKWSAKKQKFMAAFFPEMGHDPYRNMTKNPNATPKEMGHALAVYQDAFVGEIIDELQKDGQLDHTIIVISSDHGQRTVENKDGDEMLISHAKLDDRTMRVPLLIYVPKVLNKTVVLPGPTSHIDLAPTILELVGAEKSNGVQQGTAMWRNEVATRRLFLPMKVFGASGYYENGKYYSANQAAVYSSDTLMFSGSALPYDSDTAKEVRAMVERHSAIQAALVDHIVNGKN